jgi:hypothetical protein
MKPHSGFGYAYAQAKEGVLCTLLSKIATVLTYLKVELN